MSIYSSAVDLIGNTPMVRLERYKKRYAIKANILAKLEGFNLSGSAKDRIAKEMIIQAEKEGKIDNDTVIIEPTSGNTGIGLAVFASIRGYRVILTMPESMSIERQKFIKAYGAEIVLTEAEKGMRGSIEKAEELHRDIKNSFVAGQFTNKANAQAHYKSTGPEIWKDTEGKVDILVATVGSGGTITGTGRYLKEKNPAIKVIAVEPAGSPVLSGGCAGKHAIQGIGAGFVPEVLDTKIYDEVLTVTDAEALQGAKDLAKLEGLLVGISSGAAITAVKALAQRKENKDKNIAVVLPDRGERYFSTNGFID